ncbi:nucleotide-sugar transporter [Cystobasidium minutum MCA 4210]|uniref:nucleotide-sugar transporter n=1 Tax=Cystobasidium minutum MCA 4210 TaxID=1397322 RepID=UPI0034CD2255|eukprot:jgi/Rhomi1/150243/estExt_Genewise1.C_2_t30009
MVSKRTRALVLLTVQNAGISLLTRHSRRGHHQDLYLPSVAVLMAEVVKALVSLLFLASDYHRSAKSKKEDPRHVTWSEAIFVPLKTAISTRWADLAVLLVPSILYAGQNNLLYVALSNLPASVYQVTYQLKILTTAIFSVIFFRRKYSYLKWFSLLLLTVGVAIVQMPTNNGKHERTPISKHEDHQDKFLGFTAIFAACISSAIAGCYFEAILKPAESKATSEQNATSGVKSNGHSVIKVLPPPSLPMRNLQLALVSLPFNIIGILASSYDRHRVSEQGLFHQFDALAWFVVLNQALGGLLIAAVIKEADSVSKGFATSLAVLLSTAATSIATHTLPSTHFMTGASLVVSATCLFASV